MAAKKEARAFCLITAEMGREEDALRYLNGIEGVKAHPLYGLYTAVAEVRKATMDEVNKTIEEDIIKIGREKAKIWSVVSYRASKGFTTNEKGEKVECDLQAPVQV